MEKIKKIFGETNITWRFLIVFSIGIGLIVGVLNRIPILNNTSFQDIAVVFDMWIILAIFIIVNCKSWKEAVAKCFIFFLISQPIIYFTEIIIGVLIYKANFRELFTLYFKNYYIGAGWLTWTVLTIPGALIAYQIKKNNVLSAIILSVATTYLTTVGTIGLINTFTNNFPYHLLNDLICLIMAYILIFVILTNKRERIISSVLTTLGVVIGIIFLVYTGNKPILINETIDFDEGIKIVECIVQDENIVKVNLDDEGKYMDVLSSNKVGTTEIKAIDVEGNEYTYIVNSTSKNFEIELRK